MKQVFDNLSANVSKLTTQTYSTSFSMGILFLNRKLRQPIYSIYGFVRLGDEIVDSFEDYDKEKLLDKFKQETICALENRISLNPILNSFQQTVHQYKIDVTLIEDFIKSMEMDLIKHKYDSENYQKYIYGSAEVVGLMCLWVFCEGSQALYNELKPYAMSLGSAFQKINFLRDLKDDFEKLGRSYFPNVNLLAFDNEAKNKIEQEIEDELQLALNGIKKLPISSREGVFLAYIYYRTLFNKIKKVPPQEIMLKRIRINNGKKIGLMLNCLFESRMNLL